MRTYFKRLFKTNIFTKLGRGQKIQVMHCRLSRRLPFLNPRENVVRDDYKRSCVQASDRCIRVWRGSGRGGAQRDYSTVPPAHMLPGTPRGAGAARDTDSEARQSTDTFSRRKLGKTVTRLGPVCRHLANGTAQIKS